jgi:phenylalanyl-tRNA synthetase beta chain
MNILTNWLRSSVPGIAVDDHQLAEDLTLRGIAVEGVHDLGVSADGRANGHLFEMDITTNRVDAMNHYGIAREAATIYDLPLLPFDTTLAAVASGAKPFSVSIEAPELCGRFTARVLRDVTVAPSTGLVAEYFALLGLKQISNAVDASNFVLQWMGHPTHAFDLDKIEGGIVVRLARRGERLKLLDGSERTLEADDLVVADQARALGLAGVMGGWDTMITPSTRNILVEAAWFDPASVRRSARRHGFHTDASHRFERGADLNACATANALVAKLILQTGTSGAGGSAGYAEGELVDVTVPEVAARTADRPAIALSVTQVRRHLGTTLAETHQVAGEAGSPHITGELIAQYLTGLGCEMTSAEPTGEAADRDAFTVKLPSWRLDLEREIDLVEEVARVYGYNRFANTLPTALPVIAHPLAAVEAAVRTRLLALGYSEAISSSFASEADGEAFAAKRPAAPTEEGSRGIQQIAVVMENPLSDEARLLRPSLVPGMVAMLARNLNRDVREARLFEQGTIFMGTADDAGVFDRVVESASLTLGLTGNLPATPLHGAKDAGIFELKGVVESLLSLFAVAADLPGGSAAEAVTFAADTPGWIESGRGAVALLGGKPVACFGELAATQRDARKLRQPVYLAEIDLAALYALPLRRPAARELSRFPAVERDFSFLFPDATRWQVVAAALQALHIPEMTRIAPVEIFRDAKGGSVPAGSHALLLRCVFQSAERTLREEELSEWSEKIIAALTAIGGAIRA